MPSIDRATAGAEAPTELRSRIMRAIRGRDTKPELAVRRALHGAGLRFRLHRRDLPGTPDIVLPGRRAIVLVHGCFWHQHPGCAKARAPRSNVGFWGPKLERNRERDRANDAALGMLGWRVMVVWECELRETGRLEALAAALRALPVGRRGRLAFG